MTWVYIIYSERINFYYTGYTIDAELRLGQHKDHFFKGSFTARADDWQIYLLISCESKGQAIKIESHIKRMKSKSYIENLKRYPEMVERLKNRYK